MAASFGCDTAEVADPRFSNPYDPLYEYGDPIPSGPTDLRLTSAENGSPMLTWENTSSFADSFVVERRIYLDRWGSWQQIGIATGTSFADSVLDSSSATTYGPSHDHRFSYRVAAQVGTSRSDFTQPLTLTYDTETRTLPPSISPDYTCPDGTCIYSYEADWTGVYMQRYSLPSLQPSSERLALLTSRGDARSIASWGAPLLSHTGRFVATAAQVAAPESPNSLRLQVRVLDTDTGSARTVTTPTGPGPAHAHSLMLLGLSRDGRYVVAARTADASFDPNEERHGRWLFVMDVELGEVKRWIQVEENPWAYAWGTSYAAHSALLIEGFHGGNPSASKLLRLEMNGAPQSWTVRPIPHPVIIAAADRMHPSGLHYTSEGLGRFAVHNRGGLYFLRHSDTETGTVLWSRTYDLYDLFRHSSVDLSANRAGVLTLNRSGKVAAFSSANGSPLGRFICRDEDWPSHWSESVILTDEETLVACGNVPGTYAVWKPGEPPRLTVAVP
jgi:hypothetical protein